MMMMMLLFLQLKYIKKGTRSQEIVLRDNEEAMKVESILFGSARSEKKYLYVVCMATGMM